MAINHYLGSVRNRQQAAEFTPAQPSQNICGEVNSSESEVFYGPRANLAAYSSARQSYQRLCATTPTTPAEYAFWTEYAKSLQQEMNQLQFQDGKFNAEVAAAVEFYPEYLLITSAALQAVGAGMQESFVRAGRYQVENPHVPLGAVRHFAAQQGEGLVTSFTNFWPAYDAIQTAKANSAQLSKAEYIQQVGGSVPGVAAPVMVAAGVRAGLKSVTNATLPKGGAPLAVTPEGFAVAGVSTSAEGSAVATSALPNVGPLVALTQAAVQPPASSAVLRKFTVAELNELKHTAYKLQVGGNTWRAIKTSAERILQDQVVVERQMRALRDYLNGNMRRPESFIDAPKGAESYYYDAYRNEVSYAVLKMRLGQVELRSQALRRLIDDVRSLEMCNAVPDGQYFYFRGMRIFDRAKLYLELGEKATVADLATLDLMKLQARARQLGKLADMQALFDTADVFMADGSHFTELAGQVANDIEIYLASPEQFTPLRQSEWATYRDFAQSRAAKVVDGSYNSYGPGEHFMRLPLSPVFRPSDFTLFGD